MKLASIEIIKNIRNHPNAESLDIAEVLGWQVVVKKGIHKEGDRVVFITIDTIVPKCEWSEFLADKENPDKPIRIKNIKLRGEYSSGLVIPMIEFPIQFEGLDVGDDVTEMLGVKKYIKELPANLSGENDGEFPTHLISKTDEDNGLNDPNLVEDVLSSDNDVVLTLKIDGSSITIVVENGNIIKVCSRNLSKKDTPDSVFWNNARKLKIPSGWSGIIQGELAGNGIQRNQLKINDIRIYVFQIFHNNSYMNYDDMKEFCLNHLGCEVVPLLTKLNVSSTIKLWENPLHKLQEFTDKQKYPSGFNAEGIVVRPYNYKRSKSSRRPLGFKLINRNYKD
jgi:RNA ligase (TIGR02306 family)